MRGNWRARNLTVLALLATAGLAAPAAGQSPPEPAETVLVLDGSGSMWGPLAPGTRDKAAKADAVRAALKDLMPRYLASMRLGVVAFGNNRRSDCSDVDTMAPLAKLDDARFQDVLRRYNPKGKGPVGSALRQAAAQFPDKGRPATAVLVVDNADNCTVDACAAAREIKQSHPRLVAHVLAVGVPEEEIKSVACVAANTGGKLYRVNSQSDLAAALSESFAMASLAARPAAQPAVRPPPAEARPAPAPSAPKGPPGLRLAALLAAGGPPIAEGVQWRVTKAGAPQSSAALYEGADATPKLVLPPGKYEVAATYGLVSRRDSFEVGDVETRADVVLNAGIIRLKATASRGGPPLEDVFFTLYARGGGSQPWKPIALSRERAPEYHLASGDYQVTAQQGFAKIDRAISVKAGSTSDVEIVYDMGEIALRAVAREGGDPLDEMLFVIHEDDPESAQGRREVARSASSAPTFLLPAGIYHVMARRGSVVGRERITVRPGASTQQTLVLGSGRIALSSKLVGRTAPLTDRISYAIERLDRPKSEAEPQIVTSRPAAALDLVQGRYRIEGRFGLARITREVDVKAGTTINLTLEHQAGLIRFRLADGSGGAALSDVLWEVRDRSGKPVWRSALAEPKLALAAGSYVIVAQRHDHSRQRPFEVATGDEKTIELAD